MNSSSKQHVDTLKAQNKFINHDITHVEKRALFTYKYSYIVPIDDMDAQHILSVFQRIPPIQQDITVYKNTKGIDMNHMKNSFISASLKKPNTSGTDPDVVAIIIPKNSKIIPMGSILLLPPGGKYIVKENNNSPKLNLDTILYINQFLDFKTKMALASTSKDLYHEVTKTYTHHHYVKLTPKNREWVLKHKPKLYITNVEDMHYDNIAVLDVSYQNLQQIPESIGDLKKLEILLINGNRLTSLPESIGDLTQLKILDISFNQLTSLPQSMSKLTQLIGLDIHRNSLQQLPNFIGQFTKLLDLNISENRLIDLPDSIGKLKKLETLIAHHNQFTDLPDSIGNLMQLQYLAIHNNRLTSLPESIGKLQNLKTLLIYNNPLTYWPDSIHKLKNLKIS